MQQLFGHENPLITEAVIENNFDAETRVNLNEENFRIAFNVRNQFDLKVRDDPRFLKWYVRLTRNNGEVVRNIPYFPCTESDYSQFYPINKGEANQL